MTLSTQVLLHIFSEIPGWIVTEREPVECNRLFFQIKSEKLRGNDDRVYASWRNCRRLGNSGTKMWNDFHEYHVEASWGWVLYGKKEMHILVKSKKLSYISLLKQNAFTCFAFTDSERFSARKRIDYGCSRMVIRDFGFKQWWGILLFRTLSYTLQWMWSPA